MNKSHEVLRNKREKISASMEERKKNLTEKYNIGLLYEGMLTSATWKHLLAEYLGKAMDSESLVQYLHADEGRMKEEMMKMLALWDLMGFIDGQVNEGRRAAKELERLN